MKRLALWMLGTMVFAGIAAGVWAVGQVSNVSPPLARWMPSGALFYLESSDFAAQLHDWNRSDVQAKWLASKNHEQFLTTRLMLKLKDAFDEFAAAAGFAPDLNALDTFAGSDSALAVYDIGHLGLVYISKLPAAQLGQNALTRVRANYQSHVAAGQTYFVRQAGDRTAAFAISGDFVIVSTREDLIAQTLELIQGTSGATPLVQEKWYDDAVRAIGDEGKRSVDLRLVMDLPTVIKTPYFRSYWIQRNTADLSGYSAFLSQLVRTPNEFNESRVLVRADEKSVTSHASSVAELQKFIPDDVGFFRLWDTTSVDFAMNLVREKIFGAGANTPGPRRNAPTVVMDEIAGSESDLHTRIDEAPKPSLAGTLSLDALAKLFTGAGLEAVLHLESSVPVNANTFIGTDAALAFRASAPWNAAAVRSALTDAVASYQSVGSLGLQWHDVTSGGHTLSQWNGLIPLTIYVDGHTLWIGKSPALLTSAINHSATPAAQPVVYLARYNHRTELGSYLKIMRMLDLSDQANYSNFFSENVGSLASSLDAIQSVSMKINESGLTQRQDITYSLRK